MATYWEQEVSFSPLPSSSVPLLESPPLGLPAVVGAVPALPAPAPPAPGARACALQRLRERRHRAGAAAAKASKHETLTWTSTVFFGVLWVLDGFGAVVKGSIIVNHR